MATLISKFIKGDRVIWAVILVLFVASLLAVYSATGSLAYRYQQGNTAYYLMRQSMFLFMGLGVIVITHRIHYRYYAWLSGILLYMSAFLLIITLVLGVSHNEATRWLTVPGIGIEFQTSDLAKFALMMFAARVLSYNQETEQDRNTAFKQILIASGVICVLILPENFSTAALLFLTVLVMMYIGRVPIRNLMLTVGGALVGVVLLFLIMKAIPGFSRDATWENRAKAYLGIVDDPDMRYQSDQAKIAIATGGLIGKGPGNSTQRNFLPQSYSDFIYAIIAEEYGLIGAIVVLMAYLVLVYRIGRIVTKCNRTFPAFLVIGLMLSISMQALVNMAVAVNVLPVTGQPLPLVSMGGTSILFTSIALGIVLGVSRITEEEQQANRKKTAVV